MYKVIVREDKQEKRKRRDTRREGIVIRSLAAHGAAYPVSKRYVQHIGTEAWGGRERVNAARRSD
jgi:hypothetical protein